MYLLMGLAAGYVGQAVTSGGFGAALAIGSGAILVTAAVGSTGGRLGRVSSAGAILLARGLTAVRHEVEPARHAAVHVHR